MQAVAEDTQESSCDLGLPGLDKPFPLLAGKSSPSVDALQSELQCLSWYSLFTLRTRDGLEHYNCIQFVQI